MRDPRVLALLGVASLACGARSELELFDIAQAGAASSGGSGHAGMAANAGSSATGGKPNAGGNAASGGASGANGGVSGASGNATGVAGGVNDCRSSPIGGVASPSIPSSSPELVGLAARPGGFVWLAANFLDRPTGYATLIEYRPGDHVVQSWLRRPSQGGSVENEKLQALTVDSAGNAFLALDSDANWGNFEAGGMETGYVMRWSTPGLLDWVTALGPPTLRAVAMAGNRSVFVLGNYTSRYVVSQLEPNGFLSQAADTLEQPMSVTNALAVGDDGAVTVASVTTVGDQLRWLITHDHGSGGSDWRATVGCPISVDDRILLQTDEQGAVYVVGPASCRLENSAEFAAGKLDWASLPRPDFTANAFLIHKLDARGKSLWTKQVDIGYISDALSTAIDQEGLVVLGYAKQPSKLPGQNIVLKLDPQGAELWQQITCGYSTLITSDGACQTYIAGTSCDDAGVVVQRVSEAK